VLLVLVVLLQDEEGEGVGGLFSGGSSTAFGSRTGNILTRFTAILAAIFLFCAFALAWLNRSPSVGNVIGKARQETLKEGESSTWWAELNKTPPAAEGGAAQPESAPTGAK
jgi:preprotein translocase subunit SecG